MDNKKNIEDFIDYCEYLTNTKISIDDKEIIYKLFSVEMKKRSEFFIKAGEISEYLAFNLSGILRSYCVNIDGKEITTGFIAENTFVSSFKSMRKNSESKMTIQVIEGCILVKAEYKNIQEIAESNLFFLKLLNRYQEKLIMDYCEHEEDILLISDMERYEKFYVNYFKFARKLKTEYIASYLRVSPECIKNAIILNEPSFTIEVDINEPNLSQSASILIPEKQIFNEVISTSDPYTIIKDFISTYQSKSTQKSYEKNFADMFMYMSGKTLKQLTWNDITIIDDIKVEEYRDSLTEKYANTSINQRMLSCKALWYKFKELKIIRFNQFDLEILTESKKGYDILTQKEIMMFFNYCLTLNHKPMVQKLYFEFLYVVSCKKSIAQTITWNDIVREIDRDTGNGFWAIKSFEKGQEIKMLITHQFYNDLRQHCNKERRLFDVNNITYDKTIKDFCVKFGIQKNIVQYSFISSGYNSNDKIDFYNSIIRLKESKAEQKTEEDISSTIRTLSQETSGNIYDNYQIDKKSEAKIFTIDFNKLSDLNEESDQIKEKLISDSHLQTNVLEISYKDNSKTSFVKDVWSRLFSILTSVQIEVLKIILYHNKHANDMLLTIAQKNMIMIEPLIESINESAYEIINDNLIDTSSDIPIVYYEYQNSIKSMLDEEVEK